MKKVLLVIEHLGSGGAERQICGLAAMLTNAGYPCRLITYVEKQFYEPYLRENGVDYELVRELQDKNTRIIRMARYVRKYEADVVISFLPSVNLAMCLARPLFKAKLAVSERNNNTKVTSKDKFQFNIYRLADAIVPNSNSQGYFIRDKFSFLAKKVHPIINYVEVDRFVPAEIPPKNEKIRIIIVARYTQQKNVLAFLQVVREIKDKELKVHFDWFGDKDYNPEYFAEVENEYKRLDISDYIALHDSKSNIEEEYKKADVFCLPSLYEGYPNVVVEAMSCGLPVICSNRYENPYIVEDGINGFLFDPEDVEDIVLAIIKIANLSFSERQTIGKRNRQICLERNTQEAFLKSYISLIESL